VEAAEVKNDVCDAYVKYGVNVFEHDHTEKLRMREEEGVSSGGTVHGDYRFSDDEAEEVTLVVDVAEDDLEGEWQTRVVELRKEAPLVFSKYRSYNRIQLTAQRGWDQYLPQAPAAQSPVPVVGVTAACVTVTTGQAQQPATDGFFAPRPAAAATASVGPAVQTAPVGLNEAPAPQYDLMTDLLHVDMFKVLSDMLCSEVLLIKRGNSEMFEYLPMMAVATLGALNTESFCERVLSCVKLVVSDFTYV
jgi:hypothetical protein